MWPLINTFIHSLIPSISFTMELATNGKLPFLGLEIVKLMSRLETKVYKKPTDTGLLLHYRSHVDVRYKQSLLKTMLNREFKLSSNWQLFHPSSETQGLLAGTIRYFGAKVYFKRAEEPLGTYSYQTSSRTGRIPSR